MRFVNPVQATKHALDNFPTAGEQARNSHVDQRRRAEQQAQRRRGKPGTAWYFKQ